jgi:hypothetical protein
LFFSGIDANEALDPVGHSLPSSYPLLLLLFLLHLLSAAAPKPADCLRQARRRETPCLAVSSPLHVRRLLLLFLQFVFLDTATAHRLFSHLLSPLSLLFLYLPTKKTNTATNP